MKRIHCLLLLLICAVCKGQNITKTANDPYADIVSSALKDKTGNIWFAVSGRGVYCYDDKAFTNFTVKNGLCNNNINCIYEDRSGNIWFGTDVGACHYDGKTFISLQITDSSNTLPSKYNSQSAKKISSILQDKKGNFWFTTLNHGVYRYDGKSFVNFLSDEALVCILGDKIGNIWVGSWRQGGVYRYDGKSFVNFGGLSDNMIKCMLQDKVGNVWIGTRDHGIDCYDGKSIVNYSEKEGLSINDVSCIFEDKNGNIWFGSDISRGKKRGDAWYYNGKSFTNVTAKETLTTKYGFVYSVMTIVEDNDGVFWFGSRGGLLFRYDGKSFTDF